MIQWIGAICVVGACGACGFSMAASYTGLQRNLRQLYNGLELMQCQMEYQMTELPELCGSFGFGLHTARVGVKFFGTPWAGRCRNGETAEASACVAMTLARTGSCRRLCRSILSQLGKTFWGSWICPGSVRGLASAQETCRKELEAVEAEKAGRLRCYRALGLCAGAALAILLL